MKRNIFKLLTLSLLLVYRPAGAQTFKNADQYMQYITDGYSNLTVALYQYMSAAAHLENSSAIEQRRRQLLQVSSDTYDRIRNMPPYDGDASLRDSAATYLMINHLVLKDDYAKILDMEAVAKRSADDMEAYLNAQQIASEKLQSSNRRMLEEQKRFASSHNIELVQRTDNMFAKMQSANAVLTYAKSIYNIFFKAHIQEVRLLEALKSKNIDGITEYRKELLNASEEGIAELKISPAFEGDNSLNLACRTILEFYAKECEEDIGPMIAYFKAESEFAYEIENFNALSQNERTSADIDRYNKAVAEFNKHVETFNTINTKLNTERMARIDSWQMAYKSFLDAHMPVF